MTDADNWERRMIQWLVWVSVLNVLAFCWWVAI